MMNWLSEAWIVLCYSRKTQLALALGLVLFAGIMVAGQILVGSLELHGPMASLTDVVRSALMHRYDKAAWATLGSCALLAIGSYRKDRRRLLGA